MTSHIDAAPRSDAPAAPRGPAPPSAVFLPLFSPFGISSGYVSVTLAFLLSRAGLSTLEVTTIIAGTIWVQTWKVLGRRSSTPSATPSSGTASAPRESVRRSWR